MQSEGDPAVPIRVAIELDGSDDPISGSLAVGDADPSPFAGWIELASRLERARLAAGPVGAERPRAFRQHEPGEDQC